MFPDPEMSNEAIHLPQKTDFCIRQQLELHIKAWYNNLNKIWNVSKWEAEVQRNTFSEKRSWVSWISESFSFLLLQLLLPPLLQPELMLLVHLCREHSALCLNCKWSLLKKKDLKSRRKEEQPGLPKAPLIKGKLRTLGEGLLKKINPCQTSFSLPFVSAGKDLKVNGCPAVRKVVLCSVCLLSAPFTLAHTGKRGREHGLFC